MKTWVECQTLKTEKINRFSAYKLGVDISHNIEASFLRLFSILFEVYIWFLWGKKRTQKTNPKAQTEKPPIDFLSRCWHHHRLFSKKNRTNAGYQCAVMIQHSGLSPPPLPWLSRAYPSCWGVIQYFCVWLTEQATFQLQSLMAQSFCYHSEQI